MPIEPVTGGREPDAIQIADERRQCPERQCLGRGKAVLDVVDRDVGGNFCLWRRRAVGIVEAIAVDLFEPPIATLQLTALSDDPAGELVRVVEGEYRDVDQVDVGSPNMKIRRVDDRLAVLVGLAQP